MGTGTLDMKQVQRAHLTVLTLTHDIQSVTGGKSFYETNQGALSIPLLGPSEAPLTPLRGFMSLIPKAGGSKTHPVLVLGHRDSSGDRDSVMSSLAFLGSNRTLHLGFYQNGAANTGLSGLDHGRLEATIFSQALSAVGRTEMPDDLSASGHTMCGIGAAYLSMKPSPGPDTRPAKPGSTRRNIYMGAAEDVTDAGYASPDPEYRPLMLQYEDGDQVEQREMFLTPSLAIQKFHRKTDGALIISGQAQSFGSGDKTFGGTIRAKRFVSSHDAGAFLSKVQATTLSAYQYIGVSTELGEESLGSFHFLLGQSGQTTPDHPGDSDQVVFWAEANKVQKDQTRNSYWAETESGGDALPVPLVRFAKEVDGTDTHALASDRGMMRMATRSMEARHGHSNGFDGATAATIGENSLFGASNIIDFQAAAAVIIPSLIIQTSSRPVTGTLQVRIGTIGTSAMTQRTRSKGFIAEFTIDLSTEAGNADHVELIGQLGHAEVMAGPIFIQRTVANGCKIYIDLAYSGSDASDFADARIGGEYTQIGAEFIHEQTDANGPITPDD